MTFVPLHALPLILLPRNCYTDHSPWSWVCLDFPCWYSKRWFMENKRHWVCVRIWGRGRAGICVVSWPGFSVLAGVQWEVQLLESGGGLVQPVGWSLRLFCPGSGLTFNDYYTSRICQAPGKVLERFSSTSKESSCIHYTDSVKSRFTISRHKYKTIAYLKMNSLRTEDTALFYSCLWIRKVCFHQNSSRFSY
jgi:immunoglobulin heavy chain